MFTTLSEPGTACTHCSTECVISSANTIKGNANASSRNTSKQLDPGHSQVHGNVDSRSAHKCVDRRSGAYLIIKPGWFYGIHPKISYARGKSERSGYTLRKKGFSSFSKIPYRLLSGHIRILSHWVWTSQSGHFPSRPGLTATEGSKKEQHPLLRAPRAAGARNICVGFADVTRAGANYHTNVTRKIRVRRCVSCNPRTSCNCCAHLPREERATRNVTFGPLFSPV
jgi:hypothetical protein